jgi:hypothetical protein
MMPRYAFPAILTAAGLIAVCTARPYAGGWNDGSRLATVEALVEARTFRIDQSIYVHPESASRPPYAPGDELLANHGTKDKLLIDGAYYSDKSPVPALTMAGAYQMLRWIGLPAASERPDWFALAMTWLFAGLPYVFAVWCIGRVACRLGVPSPWSIVLTAGFAFGSLALPYAQHVNNHILLLAVAAGCCLVILRETARSAALLGLLSGFGYTIDLAAGPLLTVALGGYVLWKRRHIGVFALCVLPWIIAHHLLTWLIAGTLVPANANHQFLDWPGSPFNDSTMTGAWRHDSVGAAGLYALDLLIGKKGFLLFSLPLLQAVVGSFWLRRSRCAEREAVICLSFWSIGTWLVYAATSRNLSGMCLSIRWFVPLLAPGMFALLILVRDYPWTRRPLIPLLIGGLLLNVELTARGPWSPRVPWLLWPVSAVGVSVWASLWIRQLRDWPAFKSKRPAETALREPCPVATTA